MKNVMRCTLVYEIPVNPGNVDSLTVAADGFAHLKKAAENQGVIIRATADVVRVKEKSSSQGANPSTPGSTPLPQDAGATEGAA